jgi:hypothetical protein
MPPKNPSEFERLLQEAEEIKKQLRTSYCPKDIKENALRELRKIEGILGIESVPYNDERFSK